MAYNPETDVQICYMTPHSDGRIMSKSLMGGARITQYACACDIKKGLPVKPTEGGSGALQHQLTVDTRVVNCPDCQKTAVFQAAYLNENGRTFGSDPASPSVPVEAPQTADPPLETPITIPE